MHHQSVEQWVLLTRLSMDSVFVTHLLATVYSPLPSEWQFHGPCESLESMGNSGHRLLRLLAPGRLPQPHTGNSVLFRVCLVSWLQIFALLMSLLFEAGPGTVVTCVPLKLIENILGKDKRHANKVWRSWPSSSVNKPME